LSLTATVEALVAAGATPEMILAVVRTMEGARDDALARRRASDAARQKAKRERVHTESRDITLPVNGHTDTSPRAQVVIPTSSLRSEGIPPEKPSVSTPKGADASRGTRLPDAWHPEEPDWSKAIAVLGCLTAVDAELDRFRDYWRAVPGAKGRKSDWPATWRNWVRRASENSSRKAHERPHHDAKFEARQANYARAFAGAERASGRDWKP